MMLQQRPHHHPKLEKDEKQACGFQLRSSLPGLHWFVQSWIPEPTVPSSGLPPTLSLSEMSKRLSLCGKQCGSCVMRLPSPAILR